jgi:hypothetical protein
VVRQKRTKALEPRPEAWCYFIATHAVHRVNEDRVHRVGVKTGRKLNDPGALKFCRHFEVTI